MRSLPAGRDVKFSVLEYGSILRIIHLGATAITTSRPRRARTTTANRTSGRGATSSGRGRCRNRPVTLSRRLSPHRPIAWIFFYLAIRQVNKLMKEGLIEEAKVVWIKTKWYWAVWKSTSAIRRRVDGVQVDATSQHEHAVKFDFHTGGRLASSSPAPSFISSRNCGWACMGLS